MSTLKANNIQHLDSSSANIQTTQGGGTILTGVSTIGNANLVVESNVSEGVRIDSSGNVGIGTDNPTQKLEIDNVTGGASLLIRTSPSTSGGNLLFGDDASDTSGRVSYVHSSDHMYFSTNGGERLRITASGAIGIGTDDPQDELHVMGQVRISQESDVTQRLRITHQGIDFQNTGAGSSTGASAHLLDDYEEGSWTPVYQNSITDPTIVYSLQLGTYTKVGNLVTLGWRMRTSSVSASGSGNVYVAGFPFVVGNTDFDQRGVAQILSSAWAAGGNSDLATGRKGESRCQLMIKTATNASADDLGGDYQNLTSSAYDTSAGVHNQTYCTLTYFID